jgi:Tfp pilus assembly protein PilF
MNPRITALEKMLNGPRDGALLRFSLGNEYLKEGQLAEAENCFKAAIDRDKNHSAAWKALGKALQQSGRTAEALAAYEAGIAVATARGDIQSVKEMSVFAKRLSKVQ